MSAAFLTCELCHRHGDEQTEDGKVECSACNPDGETLRERRRDEMSEKLNAGTFQERVQPWMMACFGPAIAADTIERNHRFFEEAAELTQACGMTADEAHQLVDYVWNRPVGERKQEVGGVMVTLAALCLAQQLDMHECGETELDRIWTKTEQIRAKQAAKPKHSPLPEHVSDASPREALGYKLGMRVLQSDLYRQLDDAERAECDEFIARGMDVARATAVPPLQISPSSDAGAVTPEEVSALREQNAWLAELYDAVKNLIKVKGRHHTEAAYQRVVSAFEKAQRG